MRRYRFMFNDEWVLKRVIEAKNIREAWEQVKVVQLETIIEHLPQTRHVQEFKPVYQREILRMKKRRWSPWKDIKDKNIITEMKEYADELRVFIKLDGA